MILTEDMVEVERMVKLPNSLGIEATAELYVCPRNVDETASILNHAMCRGKLPRVIGGGTNLLLIGPVISGVVLHLGAMRQIRVAGTRVTVGAGCLLPQLIGETVARGLSGLELLAGIPGTLGGAVAQNAGGKYGVIGDVVESVTLLLPGGQIERRREFDFRYRDSGLKQAIILEATLNLSATADPVKLRQTYRMIMAEKNASQPLSAASAGCIFKNPSPEQPAARLLQEAGWKGRSVGGAMVSKIHSNFIVNQGGATGSDVLELIEQIEQDITQRYGLDLEREVELW